MSEKSGPVVPSFFATPLTNLVAEKIFGGGFGDRSASKSLIPTPKLKVASLPSITSHIANCEVVQYCCFCDRCKKHRNILVNFNYLENIILYELFLHLSASILSTLSAHFGGRLLAG